MANSKSNPNIKNAIVMAPDEASQSLAAFFTFLAEEIDWDVEIFHSEEEARLWIAC